MKCLTVCQPYASLIMLPDDDDRAKRCENRTWQCIPANDQSDLFAELFA